MNGEPDNSAALAWWDGGKARAVWLARVHPAPSPMPVQLRNVPPRRTIDRNRRFPAAPGLRQAAQTRRRASRRCIRSCPSK